MLGLDCSRGTGIQGKGPARKDWPKEVQESISKGLQEAGPALQSPHAPPSPLPLHNWVSPPA